MANSPDVSIFDAVVSLRGLIRGESIDGEVDRTALSMAITALSRLASVHYRVNVVGEEFTKEELAELIEVIESHGGPRE